MTARVLAAMLALLLAQRAAASPWSIQPKVGMSADYETNPELLSVSGESEGHVAALLDLPVRYVGDDVTFLFRPSGRVSDSQGYASLTSNYVHLDGSLQYSDDLNTLTLQGMWARDSSLYYVGGIINGLGVRRDTSGASAEYLRTFTERSSLQLDGSWTTVRYDLPAGTQVLTDYRYLSAGPSLIYLLDERSSVKLVGGASQYRSLDERTESRSYNAQLGLTRSLTETWSLSLTAGYSRSDNTAQLYYGPYFLTEIKGRQNATVYSAQLTRRGERFDLNLSAQRGLQPTGFAYLARQDQAYGSLTYRQSEHFDLATTATWQRALIPFTTGGHETIQFAMAELIVNWHVTPQWTVALHGRRLAQLYGDPRVTGASSGVSLDITRQFMPLEF